MAKLIKITDTKAYKIGLIQMGANVKGETPKPVLLSVRAMYCTAKEPGRWKHGFAHISFDVTIAARLVRAITKVLDSDSVPEIIEPKEREPKESKNKKRSK